MAHCIRYDVFIPVHFTKKVKDPNTGAMREVPRALSLRTLNAFIAACQSQFHGVTAADPGGPSPYKGWWQEDDGSAIEIDHLTYIFVIVELAEDDAALAFFTKWKGRLAKSTSQKEILVVHSRIQRL